MQHKEFENKMIWLIAEAKAMRETYKEQINVTHDCANDIDTAVLCLEDALAYFREHEEEPHANSSSENYRDYTREQDATK